MIWHSWRRCDAQGVFIVEYSMVMEHFLHVGINKLCSCGAGSDIEASDGNKRRTQAMSGTE